jgi:predicted dehydrogenase
MAMRLGKHCFCQKPLTRTIYEARLMAKVAREMKVATQMGNQGTASDGVRRPAALLRAGVVGAVKEVHIWTNRPIWPQGIDRPPTCPCPKSLCWDLWLGAAPARPFAEDNPKGVAKEKIKFLRGYHPFKWRGWWDFGSGALGDMGCHNVNMPFMGLDLRNPISVEAQSSGHNKDSFPAWSIITTQFAATATRPALKMVWYDGGKLPSRELCGGATPGEGGGSLVIGEKGILMNGSPSHGLPAIDVTYPKSPGHFEEWVRAIRGGEPAMSNFPDYAGQLTETVLLGNLALWAGEKIEWDAPNMRATNVKGLEGLIKPSYRQGYTLDV